MDEWQWMAAMVLAVAILLIPIAGWRLYLRTLPRPDVATEAAREPVCTPMERYDIHDEIDVLLEQIEQRQQGEQLL